MKIVATSDTHHYLDPRNVPDGDVFIHAGDLMQTGYHDDFRDQLAWLRALPHQTKIYVPGNHDFHLQVYPGPALQELRSAGVTVLGFPGNDHFLIRTLPNGMKIVGIPHVEGLPRWAFNIDSNELTRKLRSYPSCEIVVSHQPMYGFLDEINGVNHGSKVLRMHCVRTMPNIWIHGHIHEGYGSTNYEHDNPISLLMNKSTMIYNVAMCDRRYQHANPPQIIEV